MNYAREAGVRALDDLPRHAVSDFSEERLGCLQRLMLASTTAFMCMDKVGDDTGELSELGCGGCSGYVSVDKVGISPGGAGQLWL